MTERQEQASLAWQCLCTECARQHWPPFTGPV